MKLKGLWVKNYVRFKKAYLPLDVVGITKIIGKNLDSNTKLVPAGDDTNAVGKTALVSGISQLVFASTPVTQDIKSKAKKDVFKGKKTSIGLEIEHQDKEYMLEKKSKSTGVEYLIHRDKENTHVRTKKYPEEKIRSMFDMTEDEFYTLWSISSSRPSKLQLGTAATRFQFFTNFFKLNSHDEVRKLFNGMLRNAKESKAALHEILSQIDTMSLLSEEQLQELGTKLEKYKNKAQKLSKEYSDLHAKELDLAFIREAKPLMKKWSDLTQGLSVESESDIKKLLDEASRILEKAKTHDKYLIKKESYRNARNKYTHDKKKLKDTISKFSGTAPKDFAKTMRKLEVEKAQLVAALKNKPNFDKAAYDLAKKLISGADKSALEEKKEKLQNRIAVNEDTYRTLEKLKGHSNCPTCTAKLNQKVSDGLVKHHRQEAASSKKKLAEVKEVLSAFDTFEELSAARVKKKDYEESKERLTCVEKQIRELAKWQAYFDAAEKLAELEKPKKPEVPEGLDFSKEEIDKYREIKNTASLVLPIYTRYTQMDTSKILSVKEEIDRVKDELEQTNLKIPKLTSQYDLALRDCKEYKRLKQRKKSLAKEADDIQVLEMLVDAYSNKGIKLMLIRHIASVVEKNMNEYAPLVYPEPIKFKFQVVNDREFNIVRECTTKKGKETDDVRVLSGAESRAFSFLLPLAIMPLIPKERRLNVMILDEPTVNMGSARLELFVKNFIPKLNQLVQHLIIVSTGDEQYANCKTYQITKHKGQSKLEALCV